MTFVPRWCGSTPPRGVLTRGVVRGIQVVPTGISKDEAGNDVLDGYEVLYKMDSGLVLAESEVFASEAEARESYVRFFTGS